MFEVAVHKVRQENILLQRIAFLSFLSSMISLDIKSGLLHRILKNSRMQPCAI